MEQQSAPWRVFDAPAETGRVGDTARTLTGESQVGSPLAGLAHQRVAIAGAIAAVAIGVLAVVIADSGAGAATVEGPDAANAAAASGPPVAVAGEIVVDVAGAVVTPGVYRLAMGARVGDAIDAAGGFGPRVDADRVAVELNLAAALADGAQVHVPSRDDPKPTAGSVGGDSGAAAGPKVVNLNTATESELDALPGIGPVTAGKIIESRSGAPFKTIDELRERGLVGEKAFEKLKPLISVG